MLTTAQHLAVTIGPAGEAERNTYTIPLSPTGTEPATHYGCNTLATQEMLDAMNAIDQAGHLGNWTTGMRWYTLASVDTPELTAGMLHHSNSPNQSTLAPPWSFAQSLADAGLQCIVPVQAF